MTENDINKKMAAGFYRDVDLPKPQQKKDQVQDAINKLDGMKDTYSDYIYNILEMHVDLNLDDYENFDNKIKKGIKIPYIVTIDEGSGEILSIYRNYRPDDANYTRIEYFVHFKFLPGLGFYGFGLIHMIGGLSEQQRSIWVLLMQEL